MEVVDVWSGQSANALRIALRMTNERFAEYLGMAVRTVAKWNAHPGLIPLPEQQRALDTALSRAAPEDQARFAHLIASPERAHQSALVIKQQGVRDALQWLDVRMQWPDGEAQNRVGALLRQLGEDKFRTARYRRNEVSRSRLASAIQLYYAIPQTAQHRFYGANVNGQRYQTSILTIPEWVDLRCELRPDRTNLSLARGATPQLSVPMDDKTAEYAIKRLAETIALGTRLVDAPTYRLLNVNASPAHLTGDLGVMPFVEYALTYNLLEGELAGSVGQGVPGGLPLRDRFLPDVTALRDLERRACVGGPVVLTAIARNRAGKRDYTLLIQERSGNVLNETRRLAVIPKAFHQPLVDANEDSNLAMTIEREMEEELFGRPEFDLDGKAGRRADPMRPDRLSDPMRWLVDRRNHDTWHMECTAFGINAISGNFEFASLIVINDESWWDLYGGYIEANWEVEGLRRYSTLDSWSLESLLSDPNWSNEGFFGLLEGIRRLSELDNGRVALPDVEVELHR
jgi:hypothetical protein